jgi:pSer/pThr/pTyr-binding forkhead associated (FHA) protein
MARLIVKREGDRPRVIDLEGRAVSIGRSAASDVVLQDPETTVSRHHAEMLFDEGHYVVMDRGSRNGIWVGDEQVTRLDLRDQTTFSVGCFDIEFRDGSAAPTEPAGLRSDTPPRPTETVALDSGPDRGDKGMALAASKPPGEASRPAAGSGAREPARHRRPWPVAMLGLGALLVGGTILGFLLTRGGADSATKSKETAVAPAAESGSRPAPALENAQPGQTTAPETEPLAQKPVDAARPEPAERAPKPGDQTAVPVAPRAAPRTGARAAGRASVPADPWPLLARRGDETAESQRTRSRLMFERYRAAEAQLSAGQFAPAAEALAAIASEEAGYQSVGALLTQAREGLINEARQAMAAGSSLAKGGDLPGAMAEYRRATVLAPGLTGLEPAIAELAGRMTQEGNEWYRRARQFDALGRNADAASAYERVVALLPAGDPKHGISLARLKALRGGNP